MDTAKEASTPMGTSCYLDKDESRIEVNQTIFRSMIGSLLYLTTTRSDIMQSVCMCVLVFKQIQKNHILLL